jgi:dTDP-D-glucose 4,6-dehydratase
MASHLLITHTMNVFGERQNPEKYIPMVIKRVRDNEKVTVHANSEKTIAGSDIIFMQKMWRMHYYFY